MANLANRFSTARSGRTLWSEVPVRGYETVTEHDDTPADLASLRPTGEVDRLIGRQLRLRRVLLELSAEACAESIGISAIQLQAFENGSTRLPAHVLSALAGALDAPISYFFELVPAIDAEAWVSNVIAFPVDNPKSPSETVLAEQDLLRRFRAIASPHDREMLLQMAERLARN